MITPILNPMHMNHVNLIGKLTSVPQSIMMPGGRKIVSFCLSTVETCLDSHGNHSIKQNQHRLIAWGKWVQIVERYLFEGIQLAVEGKLVTRNERLENGFSQTVSEIEINDLVIL